MKREKSQWLRDQTENLSRELKVRPESDDWLQSELDQFEERVRSYEDSKQQQSNRYNQLSRAIDSTRERLRNKHVDAGKYEQQQVSHEQEVEARMNLIKDSARQYNIRGYEADLDDIQISEFMARISKLHNDQNGNVERVRGETESEMRKVREALSKVGERRSGLEEGKNSAKHQIVANDQNIGSFQSALDAIEIDEGAEAVLDANVEEINESLKQAKEQYRKSSWNAKLHEAKVQHQKIEEDVERASQRLIQATRNSKDLAQLEILKKGLSNRQRGLESLRGVHNERFQTIIGKHWTVPGLEQDFQSVTEQRAKRLRESEDRRNASARDLEQTELKLSSCRDDLRKAEKELQECSRSITNATNGDKPDTYPADLEGIQRDRDVVKADVDDFAITRKLYERSIQTAHGKGKCELCKRNFHGESEKSDFIKKMQAKIEHNMLFEMEKQLKDLENDLEEMRSVGPIYSNWSRLSESEIPRLRSEIQQLEQSKATLVRQSEQYDQEVADEEDSTNDVASLSKSVSSMVRLHSEISDFMQQIQKLPEAHEDASGFQSIDELQEQEASLKAQAKAQSKLVQNISEEQRHAQDGIKDKELHLSNAKSELSTASHQLEKKSDIAKRMEDLRKANRDHRDTVKRLEDQIQALRPQADELETKLKDIKQRGLKKEKELQQVASKLTDSVLKLTAADQKIRDYLDSGGPSRLDRCHQDIRGLEQDIEKTDAEQKRVITEINKVSEELRDHKDTRRIIKENLDFRRSKRELEDVEREISRLSEQNAEADLERLQAQAGHWEVQYQKHTTEKSSKLATMKAKDDQLQELLKDWKTDYQNAAHEYKEAHIKVEVSAVRSCARLQTLIDGLRQRKPL